MTQPPDYLPRTTENNRILQGIHFHLFRRLTRASLEFTLLSSVSRGLDFTSRPVYCFNTPFADFNRTPDTCYSSRTVEKLAPFAKCLHSSCPALTDGGRSARFVRISIKALRNSSTACHSHVAFRSFFLFGESVNSEESLSDRRRDGIYVRDPL